MNKTTQMLSMTKLIIQIMKVIQTLINLKIYLYSDPIKLVITTLFSTNLMNKTNLIIFKIYIKMKYLK